MQLQEQECFLERCRLRPDQLGSLNILKTALHEDVLCGYDALFIGGAGEYSATEDYSWSEGLFELVRKVYREGFPTFGSCWGHQIIARALGGVVINDPTKSEMGCLPIELTEAGQNDQLFGTYPLRLRANMGHHDRVVTLPPGALELAFSDSQPNQAFRMKGLPIFGTQFHSELDARREKERIIKYRSYYLDEVPDEEAFDRIISELADTTEMDHLMFDFLRKFVAV